MHAESASAKPLLEKLQALDCQNLPKFPKFCLGTAKSQLRQTFFGGNHPFPVKLSSPLPRNPPAVKCGIYLVLYVFLYFVILGESRFPPKKFYNINYWIELWQLGTGVARCLWAWLSEFEQLDHTNGLQGYIEST